MKKLILFLGLTLIFGMFGGCADNDVIEDIVEEERVFKNLSGDFRPLEEFRIQSDLPEPDFETKWDRIEATLNLYKEYKYDVVIEVGSVDSVVKIDGKEKVVYAESFVGAELVDIDINDEYKELVLYYDGPSMDPGASFIRYDGEEIIVISDTTDGYTSTGLYGYFDADEDDVGPTYGAIWADGKGKLVTPFVNFGFVNPRIATGYYEIEDNEYILKTADTKDVLGEYEIANDFDAFFTPMDSEPENYEDFKFMKEYSFEDMNHFEEGKKIRILGYGEMYGYYSFFVEYEGEKGVIAFWMGD